MNFDCDIMEKQIDLWTLNVNMKLKAFYSLIKSLITDLTYSHVHCKEEVSTGN